MYLYNLGIIGYLNGVENELELCYDPTLFIHGAI